MPPYINVVFSCNASISRCVFSCVLYQVLFFATRYFCFGASVLAVTVVEELGLSLTALLMPGQLFRSFSEGLVTIFIHDVNVVLVGANMKSMHLLAMECTFFFL